MQNSIPLQDRVHKDNPIRNCFGCGADNPRGLRLKSFEDGDEVVARWTPGPDQCSYPGYLNGGITATLLDCHAAWAAFADECRTTGKAPEMDPSHLPAGWTRAMHIEFIKAIPLADTVELRAHVVKKGRTSRTVTCSLYSGGVECAKAEVVLVMTGA
jgi:acyl-coenzyme A thioesterase PaaI-like protein